MVEELLNFLVGVVDTQLLETVELYTEINSVVGGGGYIWGKGDALV
jgi:hypothetical protein